MSHIRRVPHPSEKVAEPNGLMTRVWWSALDSLVRAIIDHMPLTGTATFAADTTVAVTFADEEASTNYNVIIEPVDNRTYWVTNKTTSGFTINADASNSDTVGWTIVRRV
jgi:hypothetical protein